MTEDQKLYPEESPESKSYILKLSGRHFDKGLNISELEMFDKKIIKRIYTIDIDLETNPEFLNCDLKDDVEIFLKENNDIIFRGIIKESFVDEKKAKIEAQGVEAKLNYVSIIGIEASRFLGVRDLASLLISPVEELRIGNTPDILDDTIRNFIVIVPIRNLIIEGNHYIGKVKFYTEFNTIDDKIIGRSSTGRKVLDWNSFSTRARVIVAASEFRTALIEGYNEISTAVDFIALRNDMSFPRLEINEKNEFPHFEYDKLMSHVTIPTWVYCREDDTDLYAILNLNFPKNNVLSLKSDAYQYFKVIDQISFNLLSSENKTREEKRLLMALHWLRRSLQNGDNKDKLIDLWTAMEFVMSGIEADEFFCTGQIDSIIQIINLNAESLSLTDLQKDALISKIRALNNAPLMVRIEALKEKLGIGLSDEEIKLMRVARDKRNRINHGKDTDIYEKELNKLRSIIERLLIGRISLLNQNAK